MEKRAKFGIEFWIVAMVAGLIVGGCAAPMTSLQKAQFEYTEVKQEAERIRKEREAKERAALEATQAVIAVETKETEAKAGLAVAKREEAARLQAEREAQAKELEARAREIREAAGKDAAALEREATELVPPPAPVKAAESFVDVEISGMATDKVRRLSEFPKGWTLEVDAEAARLKLSIDGKLSKAFGAPAEGFQGRTLCWRLYADRAEACPATKP